jgi:epoxyqueuosine reductase QueG
VDDVGIADASAYSSPRSPELQSVFPEISSLVVLTYKELSSCESENMQIAMNGRLDLMEYSRSCDYRTARFIEREYGARAMTSPVSYPLAMTRETQGAVADVSARHAAVAAGQGVFGRNNLVLHTRFGSRTIFTVVMTDLDLAPDRPLDEEICTMCMECVEQCPSGALDDEGKTDVLKCVKTCQPYGIGGSIRFWGKYGSASPDERKEMVVDDHYWRLYHASSIGFQYFCFNCIRHCPVGVTGEGD